MSKTVTIGLSLAVGVVVGIAGSGWLFGPPAGAQTAATPVSFSAVQGAVGADVKLSAGAGCLENAPGQELLLAGNAAQRAFADHCGRQRGGH